MSIIVKSTESKAPVQTKFPCEGPEKDNVQTPWCPRSNPFLIRQLREAWGKDTGTGKFLFRPSLCQGLPFEEKPVLGHGAKMFA